MIQDLKRKAIEPIARGARALTSRMPTGADTPTWVDRLEDWANQKLRRVSDDLERLRNKELHRLLDLLERLETEPSVLGASPHLLGVGYVPDL